MQDFLATLGIQELNSGVCTGLDWLKGDASPIDSISPVDGHKIATVKQASKEEYEKVMQQAHTAFLQWRQVPAPKRGEIVRQMGDQLRIFKEPLGKLVSYEMGKSLQEGLGEVQEMIDICDFAVGLSRQLYGLTMHSERPNHRMYEQWHPLGAIGVITAFNFPVAVWAWNAMLALVCGDTVVWKPSSKTPLCAIATHKIMEKVLRDNNLPEGLICLITGNSRDVGDIMLNDQRLSMISATGSTRMGKIVAEVVGRRFGKTILELGGNNAIIVSQYANQDMAIRAVVFGAVGTAGQRCTTTRRLIIHESIYEGFKNKLVKAYSQLTIGDPLDSNNLVGPLIDTNAIADFHNAIKRAKEEGGTILCGGETLKGDKYVSGCYVSPCIVEVQKNLPIVCDETFAPILYIMPYSHIDQAIALQNEVPQGLSSAIFTDNLQEAELFLSAWGSDCGIANVNIGTSGAEIGGAFGGEKETGGGRESGSDSWKQYMRRQTNTINYGNSMPLAQGIKFDI